MSEELGGHPAKWAADNINVRWKFTNEQIGLINDLIESVWPDQTETKEQGE